MVQTEINKIPRQVVIPKIVKAIGQKIVLEIPQEVLSGGFLNKKKKTRKIVFLHIYFQN